MIKLCLVDRFGVDKSKQTTYSVDQRVVRIPEPLSINI